MIPPRITLTELLTTHHEPPLYVVDGLLSRGDISLLVAHPKAGKSTLVRNLMTCVVQGRPFFGRPTTMTPVVYYVLEEQAPFLAADFRAMQVESPDIFLRVGQMPKTVIPQLLTEDITATGAQLAVVDPLFDALAVDDANSYARVNEAMKSLVTIARRTTAHIVTVHHTNKADLRGGLSILGSQALAGATACNIFLTLRRDGVRLVETQNRVGTPIDLSTLAYNPTTREVRLDTDVGMERVNVLAQVMFDCLPEDGGLAFSEWRTRVRGRNTEKSMAVGLLVTARRVMKENGVWKRVPKTDN